LLVLLGVQRLIPPPNRCRPGVAPKPKDELGNDGVVVCEGVSNLDTGEVLDPKLKEIL